MLIVQKYGGTSVANTDRIKKIAEYALKVQKSGVSVVVVVSAMSGETNRLLNLGNEVSKNADREIDALVSTGENVSAALTAAAIISNGGKAISLNASQVKIVSDNCHQRAKMKYIETERIKNLLSQGYIVVIAGFQGITEDGDITTIGRGGSDTSAVAIAAALNADLCEIYTDVDGVFSADPNLCPNAKKIDKISYEELLETAGAGAKVVHMHAVELAAKHNVPLEVKLSPSFSTPAVGKSASPVSGTSIVREEINMDNVLVSVVTHTSNEARISIRRVPNKIGLTARIFEPLAAANINVDMIVNNVSADGSSDVSFTVNKPDLKRAMQIAESAAKEMKAGKVEAAGDVGKVSIVGIGMRSHAGVAAKMFDTLASEGIDIQMISTSEIKVSVIVDSKHIEKAVHSLHKAFIN